LTTRLTPHTPEDLTATRPSPIEAARATLTQIEGPWPGRSTGESAETLMLISWGRIATLEAQLAAITAEATHSS
jgi:hypothetical protein